jgi:hypothetical protein
MTAWLGAAPPSPSPMRPKGDRTRSAPVEQGADVSAAKGDGMTALHFAAARRRAMTEMLVYAAPTSRRHAHRSSTHRCTSPAAPATAVGGRC